MKAFQLGAAALAFSVGLPAVASAQGRHVFEIDPASSSLALSGFVTIAGATTDLEVTPGNVVPSGSFAADLTGTDWIHTGQFVGAEGVSLFVPPVTIVVPGVLPFLPPTLTVTTTALEFELQSRDELSFPISFPVTPGGTFSTTGQLCVLSGEATLTGLVNETVDLTDTQTDLIAFAGSVISGPDGFSLSMSVLGDFAVDVEIGSVGITLDGIVSGTDRPFAADVQSLPFAVGGTQTLTLSAGQSSAGLGYFVGTSAAGTEPGVPLPNGGLTLPLNPDLFLVFSLANPGTFPFGDNFGTLDTLGRAMSTFTIPLEVSFQGMTYHHAYTTFQGTSFLSVSDAIPLTLN
ncbi:MAG: hypothetical protein AAF682_07155 [Planctomycetota bacterium]